jgi:hypothetical protein
MNSPGLKSPASCNRKDALGMEERLYPFEEEAFSLARYTRALLSHTLYPTPSLTTAITRMAR